MAPILGHGMSIRIPLLILTRILAGAAFVTAIYNTLALLRRARWASVVSLVVQLRRIHYGVQLSAKYRCGGKCEAGIT